MNISLKPGLYLHIPFCRSKCGYCDFYSIVDTTLISPFIDAVLTEIKRTGERTDPSLRFDTLYIGGGTPSLLSPKQIELILQTLARYFSIDHTCETTIEINPGTVSASKLGDLRKLGINRISIGVQSFNDHELQVLERIHSSVEALETIRNSRAAGFDNINIDLIYALPGQKFKTWQASLQTALAFSPEHLSLYNLTYEIGTPFFQRLQKGELKELPETREIKLYLETDATLREKGYRHYEISSYCRSEQLISRHNYKYWTHTNYLGFGPGAHSFWDNKRLGNLNDVSSYIERLRNDLSATDFSEDLSDAQIRFEHILLSLRTYQGLSLTRYETKFNHRFTTTYSSVLEKLADNNLAELSDDFFRLTNKGMLIYNEIVPEFAAN